MSAAPFQLSFLTTRRKDLFSIAHILAESLPPERLLLPDEPVTISICGTFGAGKSIFAEEIRSTLQVQGLLEPHEAQIHSGQVQSQMIQINFIDAGYSLGSYPTSPGAEQEWKEAYTRFQQVRNHGGVDIISNDVTQYHQTDISIWVEDPEGRFLMVPEKSQVQLNMVPVLERMAQSLSTLWNRYISLTFRDPRHLATPEFAKALERFKAPDFSAPFPVNDPSAVWAEIMGARRPMVLFHSAEPDTALAPTRPTFLHHPL